MNDDRPSAARRAAAHLLVAAWSSREPLKGGITNTNFLVEDRGRRYFVRIGDDIPVHGVLRFNELAASRAAHAAGLSPAIVHAEPGVLVHPLHRGPHLRRRGRAPAHDAGAHRAAGAARATARCRSICAGRC